MGPMLREERDRDRIRRAAAAARAANGTALDAALAQIGTAFDTAAAINSFKIRIERLIGLGPDHPALKARFGARAALLHGRDLAAAIAAVERCWRAERKAFQIASALGYGNRLSLEVLRELRLILRLMRFKRMAAHFPEIVAALREEAFATAAE